MKWLFILCILGASILIGGLLFYTSIIAYERTEEVLEGEPLFIASGESHALETITFVGDIMLSRDVENTMKKYGASYPYTHIEEYLASRVVVGNFESAIPSVHIPTPSMTMRFSVDPVFIPALRDAGFTHLSLANNHAFDYGQEGYTNAQDILRQSGMVPFGHPYELATTSVSYVEGAGRTVALVGIYAVVANPSVTELSTLMEVVRAQSDLQIAYIHWGNEYELAHSDLQETLARNLIAEGVDLIVGHHPHVVQDIAVYEGVPVFYSLGNFVFDQYFNSDVQEGLMVTLSFDGTEDAYVEVIPVSSINSRVSPRILTGYERTRFLEALAKRSDTSISDVIQEGIIPVSFPSNELHMTNNSI